MAKTLYLVRHANSSWAEMHLSDFDRPLNKRGLHDAPMMGNRLRKRGVKPEIILCSPAERTRQTAELLIREFGGTMEMVQFDDRIYEASPETLLELIRTLPDTCSSAMLIGHNPSIGYLVHQLSETGIERMPTCAIANLEVETGNWKNIDSCPIRLVDFYYPKRDAD